MMGAKGLLMALVSHLDKKLFLPGLLDVMLCDRDMQDLWRDDAEFACLKKVVLWGFCFMIESVRHSSQHRQK